MERNEYGIFDEREVVNNIIDIDKKINEELGKEKQDKELICKLRFEQMLKGLYLQAIPDPYNY